ncbi:AMP-dependent synthetase and ligase [Alcanivorax hongdengensis A-11-3]|uniref:AMP-dependent synthetase and ligase n=1 Tax=Alcanivorax hongdengensis A-11-3 TaxID=1177179 RepID=L0WA51_9GAMM|nr:AMP-dependent synthetase and ligase [Alcanivorax hongdengensis A-11-3]
MSEHARQRPQVTALDGEQPLSYGELLPAIEALAARLLARQVQRLALCGDNSPAWIIADLAAQHAGCVVVPVPGFFSAEQVAHLYARAGIDAVYHADTDTLQAHDGVPAGMPPETAKVTFTSGSTGQPKGVCLTLDHQRRTVLALAERLAPHAGDRHLCVLPFATLLENLAGIYLPLWLGATVVVRPLASLGFTGSSTMDPFRLFQSLNETRPESLILVPELLRLLTLMAGKGLPVPDSLRYIAVGGGKVDPTLLSRAHALGLPVYEGYGLSECGSVVALNVPGDNRPGCAGRPLGHVQLTISERGEIQVRDGVMAGYLGEPTAARTWGTGDLGVLDHDGFLRVSGRAKNLLITAYGRNVNPEWVESVFQACDTLRSVVVFGDGEPSLSAVLVPLPGVDDAALADTVARVNASLPDYARVSHWLRVETPFSADNGLATANGRPRREAIFRTYGDALQQAGQATLAYS